MACAAVPPPPMPGLIGSILSYFDLEEKIISGCSICLGRKMYLVGAYIQALLLHKGLRQNQNLHMHHAH